jgi:hypothetical protein
MRARKVGSDIDQTILFIVLSPASQAAHQWAFEYCDGPGELSGYRAALLVPNVKTRYVPAQIIDNLKLPST